MTITTTITFQDLIHAYDDELAELEDAYDEAQEQADAELDTTAEAYNEAGKAIQSRVHSLKQLADEYDGNRFELKMLTGRELMDIETQLRATAQERGVDVDVLTSERQGMVVDAATVDAPAGIPTDDSGSPTPSECPNPLTLALYEKAERLNQSGDTDFRAPGFGDAGESDTDASSATPTPSEMLSSPSDGDGETPRQSGDSA